LNTAINRPAVLFITAGRATADNFPDQRREVLSVVDAAVDAGVAFVQIREKQLSARLLSELTAAVVAAAEGSETKVLVNDRADVAFGSAAHGVHLTTFSIPAKVIREKFPERFVVGVSTHSLDEVMHARDEGADYAIFGPVFATPGKQAAQGLDELKRVCDAVAPFPVVAIGGIDRSNCEAVIAAGASGVAGIRSFNDAASLVAICRTLQR
jgi:thiamine-phosphate pyrophosphorylase